jgi:hypothetical protein
VDVDFVQVAESNIIFKVWGQVGPSYIRMFPDTLVHWDGAVSGHRCTTADWCTPCNSI